ncbi:MAG: GumC family protein [Tissierella sp.]|uniref:GumC family protein n=1 Tax=Tissierella sp. TaxID=41274 RepID=UPI003F94793E
MYDNLEDVSIKDIINILLKRKGIIAIVTIGCLLLGMLQSFVITKAKYASSVSLEVNRLEPIEISTEDSNRVHNLLETITDSSNMEFGDYIDEITSDEVLEETIKDLKLEDTYTTSSLRGAISVSSDPETDIIDIRVTVKDPKRSLELLESLTENFREHVTTTSQENASKLLEVIEDQMHIEKEKYSKTLEEYRDATDGIKTAEEINREIEGMYEQLTKYKLDLNDLEIKKDGIEAGLEKSASSQSETMAIRPNANSDSIYLDTGKGTLEIDLAETNARIASTKQGIKDIQESIQNLKKDYQETELTESMILKKVELAQESYEVFEMKYEELNMQSSMDIGNISINVLWDTVSENNPVGTRKIIKLAMFLVVGLMTGVIVAFILEYIEYSKSKKTK